MRIEYIGHSGVLVELDHMYLLFDCIGFEETIRTSRDGITHDIGRLPDLDPDKELVVFVSHNHGDHYSEKIWSLRRQQNLVDYIISKDVHFSTGVRARLGIDDQLAGQVLRLKNYTSQDVTLSDGSRIHVQTIPSTDEGVAYLVKADGRIIYHAGDHHLWLWDAEGEKYMADMTKAFRSSVARLELAPEETIDIAFLLLDRRLANHAYDGMDAYLDMLPIKAVLPIHQWRDYSITDEYIRDRQEELKDIKVLKVTGENSKFEL